MKDNVLIIKLPTENGLPVIPFDVAKQMQSQLNELLPDTHEAIMMPFEDAVIVNRDGEHKAQKVQSIEYDELKKLIEV